MTSIATTRPTPPVPEDRSGPLVVVVGGGITGLTAAYALSRQPHPPAVILLEAADRLGGKILTTPFAGLAVDAGADAFLARTPASVEIFRQLGLEDELVTPSTDAVYLWNRRGLAPVPASLVLGVPTDLRDLARSGLLSRAGVARAAVDLTLPAGPLAEDESVGALVRRRLGAEVLERLVEPFVGGINAGHPDRLSVRAALPQLEQARRHGSLIRGLRAQRRTVGPGGRPTFFSLKGGLGRLVDALGASLGGVDVRLASAVTRLEREASGYRLAVDGPGAPRGGVLADAVVLALPAWAASHMVQRGAPPLGALLRAQDHASVTLVTMAFPTAQAALRAGRGFLVPREEGRLTTACTWMSSKWSHLGSDDQVVVRASTGRIDDPRAGELADEELVAHVTAELTEVIGLRRRPTEVRVSRWDRSMPQYVPGHLDWLDRLGRTVARELPGVVLVGGSYGGIGVPACVDQGRRAALAVRSHLATRAGTATTQGET